MSDVTEGGTAPADWYRDESGRHDYRYWDGSRWTDQVSDRGVASSDGAGTQVGSPTGVPAGNAAGTDVYRIGDIGITADTIITPNGSAPLKDSQWFIGDSPPKRGKVKARMPAYLSGRWPPSWPSVARWAITIIMLIVLALLVSVVIVVVVGVVLALAYVSPLLPAGKEHVKVTVRSESLMYTTHMSAANGKQVDQIRRQVAYAQSLAVAAG